MQVVAKYPSWWKTYCHGEKVCYWDDGVVLQGTTMYTDTLHYLLYNSTLLDHVQSLYEKYHIIDTTRPAQLRIVDTDDANVLQTQFRQLLRQLWEKHLPSFVQKVEKLMVPFIKCTCRKWRTWQIPGC